MGSNPAGITSAMRNKKATQRVAFVVRGTMGACSQIVTLIIKGAVRSTAFLLHIAEDPKGKALSGAAYGCVVANPVEIYSLYSSM